MKMGANVSTAISNSAVTTNIAAIESVKSDTKAKSSQIINVEVSHVGDDFIMRNTRFRIGGKTMNLSELKSIATARSRENAMSTAVDKLKAEMSGLNLAQVGVSTTDMSLIQNMTATATVESSNQCTSELEQKISVIVNDVGGSVDLSDGSYELDGEMMHRCLVSAASNIASELTGTTSSEQSIDSKITGLSGAEILMAALGGALLLFGPILIPLIAMPLIGNKLVGRNFITGAVLLASGVGIIWYQNGKRRELDEKEAEERKKELETTTANMRKTARLPIGMLRAISAAAGVEPHICNKTTLGCSAAAHPLLLAEIVHEAVAGKASFTEVVYAENEDAFGKLAPHFAYSAMVRRMIEWPWRAPFAVLPVEVKEGEPESNEMRIVFAADTTSAFSGTGSTSYTDAKTTDMTVFKIALPGVRDSRKVIAGASWLAPYDPPAESAIQSDKLYAIFQFQADKVASAVSFKVFGWQNGAWKVIVKRDDRVTRFPAPASIMSAWQKFEEAVGGKTSPIEMGDWTVSERVSAIDAPRTKVTKEPESGAFSFLSRMSAIDGLGAALIGLGTIKILRREQDEREAGGEGYMEQTTVHSGHHGYTPMDEDEEEAMPRQEYGLGRLRGSRRNSAAKYHRGNEDEPTQHDSSAKHGRGNIHLGERYGPATPFSTTSIVSHRRRNNAVKTRPRMARRRGGGGVFNKSIHRLFRKAPRRLLR
jgi:hypothetical protein